MSKKNCGLRLETIDHVRALASKLMQPEVNVVNTTFDVLFAFKRARRATTYCKLILKREVHLSPMSSKVVCSRVVDARIAKSSMKMEQFLISLILPEIR